MEAMDSLWKISKETSPLAHGLSEQQPLRTSKSPSAPDDRPEFRKENSRKALDVPRDIMRERSKSKGPNSEGELGRRLERMVEEKWQQELCKMEDLVSAAIGRFGESFTAQLEALRRDVANQGQTPQSPSSHADRNGDAPLASPTGNMPVRSLLEEQRLATEAQISGLVARVNALQKSLAEVVVEQELHHIATGRFACTVSEFSQADREASLAALNAQEAAAKERLRKLRRLPRTNTGGLGSKQPRTPSVQDGRGSAASSASSTATVPLAPPRRCDPESEASLELSYPHKGQGHLYGNSSFG